MKQYQLEAKDLVASITPNQLICMRFWINECLWSNLDIDAAIDELTDTEVLNGVEYHYHGGVRQFLKDGE